MPPPGAGKRKRGDRSYSGDDFQRPSPHRPAHLTLAQQQSSGYGRDYSENRGRGGRRTSRGGRGTYTMNGNTNQESLSRPPIQPPTQQVQDSIRTNGNIPSSPDPPRMPSEEPIIESEIRPFQYKHVTEAIRETWNTGGQQELVNQGVEATRREDDITLGSLMQELVQSTLAGRISAIEGGNAIKQIIAASEPLSHFDGDEIPTLSQAAFLDIVSISTESKSELSSGRLSALISATGMSMDLLRQELDASLLERLGLIRNTFARMGIRKQTNILYRQANFNLMREESEGFAKLMTELFTTASSEPPFADVVDETVEKVKAMIGAFDLDVGRSLDVVLDVFGAVLIKQFRFFVKFLRASPWWPRESVCGAGLDPFDVFSGLPQWALPTSDGWHLTDDQEDHAARQTAIRDEKFWERARKTGLNAFYELGRAKTLRGHEDDDKDDLSDGSIGSQWVNETGTMPPTGNRDAAQLLGFKLRFYSSSSARDENDVLPDNLIYLSALLIKIGFISLSDLYPHIWRSDEDMEELRKQKLAEKAEREKSARPGAGARNALLMAGALADDTLPIPSRLRETGTRSGTPSKEVAADKTHVSKETPPESADQKVLLLKSLLAIGALPESLFILGRFPWLVELYPEMPEYLHRILHHSLSHVYASVQPLPVRDSLQDQKPLSETDLPGISKGQVRLVDPSVRKVLRWALLDRSDSSDGLDYRFYWDEWNDNVPVCRTVDDVFVLCETLFELVGVKIGQDPALLLKLARIGKHSLSGDSSDANRSRWLDLSKRLLLPSLSLTRSNAGVVNEVFELISKFPINVRYLMYLEWLSGRTSRNPDVKSAFDQAKSETKDLLKRISKTNIRPMARALAKVAYANPHVVITTALAQIEVYDSIAEVFVEGAKYFTDLGYDILTWAMISSMSKAGRDRTREGGLFTSKWLVALSNFAGKIFKRYNIMRPGPILQYVADQLDSGNSTDLVMLEHLISSMAGIASDANYNDAQLQAMGGGDLLQAQTLIQLLDRRHESRLHSRRLMRSLRETGLTGKLLISLAQQRQACTYSAEVNAAPLKLLGMIFDDVHRTMIQYLELLRTNLDMDEFSSIVPSVVQLLCEYKVSPEIAFWISRPVIARRMIEVDKEDNEKKKADVAITVSGDVDMTDEINGAAEEDGEELEVEMFTEAVATPTPAEISGSALDDIEKQDTAAATNVSTQPRWHPVLEDLMSSIGEKLPEEVITLVGAGFYVTFWQLSLYDISIPGKSYEDELQRQHKRIAIINADRSDVSIAGSRKKEAEKKQLSSLIDRLLSENKDHLKAFAESKTRLSREKDQWFAGKARIYEQLNSALMEHCFLPRLLSSPLDSFFCFKFVKFLHAAGTPNFRTLGFYDLLFKQDRLTSLIFTCSPKEADNLGRFLNEILRDLGRWHKDKAVYEKEAFGTKHQLPGFAMKLEAGKAVTFLDFESFRRILYKWHQVMGAAIGKCFSSSEYMHIRNAISVLRAVYLNFPAVNFHGTTLVKQIDKLEELGKEDLTVASKSLLGTLRSREKTWILPQAFRKGQDRISEGPAKSATPQKSKLSEVVAVSLQATESAAASKTTAEDGEVADAVMTNTAPASVDKEQSTAVAPEEKSTLVRHVLAEATEDDEPKAAVTTTAPRAIEDRTAPASAPTAPRVNGVPSLNNRHSSASKSNAAAEQPLPRRVSPPPRPLPTSLPSRPDMNDSRNSHRDSSRIHARPAHSQEPRQGSDTRQSSARYSRPNERVQETPFERPVDTRHQERAPGRSTGGREDYIPRSDREASSRHPVDDRLARPHDRDRGMSDNNFDRAPRSRPDQDQRLRSDVPAPAVLVQANSPVPAQTASVAVNPERAALIEQALNSRPNISIRGQAQERSARSSRPESPSRTDDRRNQPRLDREIDDRQRPRDSHSRPTVVSPPLSRNERPPSGGYESRQQYPPRTVDMQHGRLEQDFSHRPQSQGQDRPSEAEVPSGPRGRSAVTGPRNRGPPPPPVNTQVASAPNERPTPTGPARPHTRSNSHAEVSAQSPGADSAGVHPDRLRQILPSPAEVHPPSFQSRPPVPSQAPPPAGPRVGGNPPIGAPLGPSPTTMRGPPSGPQNPNDVSIRGGRNRHPLTAVNNTLQQAGQGPSARGRGGRQNSGPVTPHIVPPMNGQGPRSEAFVPPGPLYESRGDLFGQSNGVPPRSDREPRDLRGPPRRVEETGERRSTRQPSGRNTPERDSRNDGRERDGHRGERDERHTEPFRHEEPRRSGRRDPDGPDDRIRGYNGPRIESERRGPQEDLSSRKHGREDEGAPYGNPGRGGARMASESKRRRG